MGWPTRASGGAVRRIGTAAALTLLVAVLPVGGAAPSIVRADSIGASGEVVGADVEGTIWLDLDPYGGSASGSIDMTVTFKCGDKTRYEHHLLDITKGRVDGDRILATAVYADRSGLPKDELSRCKSAYETYQTRQDSRRLVGTIDAEAGRASGTLGEYRPTVSWQVSWASAPPPVPSDDDAQPEDGE